MPQLPTIPEKIPTRGNKFTRWIARNWFSLTGWRIEGQIPNVPKAIGVAAPHSSALDVVVAIFTIFALDLDAHWMAKHTLFRKPTAWMFNWFGAIPVNRSAPRGAVQQIVEQFTTQDQFLLGLAPEGTRKNAGVPVTEWKSGYYRIAKAANAPIVPIFIDLADRCLTFGEPQLPTDDMDADLAALQAFYTTMYANVEKRAS